jgi:antitoxin CcdA
MPKEPRPEDDPKPAGALEATKEVRWLEENGPALDAANAHVEACGLPLARHRKF